jgi:hypothetical protein
MPGDIIITVWKKRKDGKLVHEMKAVTAQLGKAAHESRVPRR